MVKRIGKLFQGLVPALILCLAVQSGPAIGQSLTGQDDPRYQADLARLLQADDRAAYADLRLLAAAGNQAALQLLPFAARWMVIAPTPTGRAALRQIHGQWIQSLAEQGHAMAGLWRGGEISGLMDEQVNRALALYAVGEAEKGDALLEGWYNHLPGSAPLPAGFADLPAAAWLKAAIVEHKLAQGDPVAEQVLRDWLSDDRIEGWMVLSQRRDHYADGRAALELRLNLARVDPARLAEGRLARALLWAEDPAPPQPPQTVALVIKDLMARPQYAAVRAYCAAACATSAPACEAAFVVLFGQPYRATTPQTPFAALLDPARFFASPRGEQVLLGAALTHHLGLDRGIGDHGALQTHPAILGARKVDACLVDGALRAQGPLPQNP